MKSILCFSRSYLANLLSELGKNDQDFEYYHIVQSREELRLIESKGGKVILCLENEVKKGMKTFKNSNIKFNEPEDFRSLTEFNWSPIMSDRYLSHYNKIDREYIAKIIFSSIEKIFNKYKFDFFMSEVIAIFSAQTILYFSKKNDTKIRLFSPCYFPGYFNFTTNLANTKPICSRGENINSKRSEYVITFAENVILDKSGPKYHYSFAKKDNGFFAYFKQRKGNAPMIIEPNFKTKLIQFMRLGYALLIKYTYPLIGDFQLAKSWKEQWFYFKCLFFRKSYYDLMPSNFNVNNVMFPLHFEPEAALTYLSPANDNQIDLIESIVKTLPSDKILWVKEHPNQFGALNMKKWKNLRNKYSNLRYVFGRVSGRKLMKSSALVISVSSSAGMDALLLGKNVIVLGDIFYNKFRGAIFSKSIPEISDLLNSKDIYVKDNGLGNLAIDDLCEFSQMSYKANIQSSETLFSEENLNDLLYSIKTEFI